MSDDFIDKEEQNEENIPRRRTDTWTINLPIPKKQG